MGASAAPSGKTFAKRWLTWQKQKRAPLKFDRVIIETTGVADPWPCSPDLFMDDEIAELYLLDAIVTLVDAKHADKQLDDRQEAPSGRVC